MSENMFSGNMDPEIAQLMGIGDEGGSDNPDFTDLFDEEQNDAGASEEVDLTKERFPQITKIQLDHPNPLFSSADFYKKALAGEGESSHRVHEALTKFLKSSDSEERSTQKGRLISFFWNVLESIAMKAHKPLRQEKQFLLRYGFLLPTLVTREQRETIGKIIIDDTYDEPIHYLDEWFAKVAKGIIGPSATDEVKHSAKNSGQRYHALIEKAKGNRDLQVGLIKSKMADLEGAETLILSSMKEIVHHPDNPNYPGLKDPYSAQQKAALSELHNQTKLLLTIDKELMTLYRELDSASEQLEELREKAEAAGDSFGVDGKTLENEFNSVRQMVKMCIGRQGNPIPVLMKQYFRPNIREIATRENVIQELTIIENLDTEVFKRTFKRQTNRIVPHILLAPCYGDQGVCWEPFERFNRATSRGRIAIPMYPKDLRPAVLAAVADLRWQVAKERAQHYWMEEGLTGYYYQWFTSRKLRGDVKEYFIRDYILWITKESEGTQKLDREVRSVFWRYIPFPQELKDQLRKRGFVYNELHKRDQNRAVSDGY